MCGRLVLVKIEMADGSHIWSKVWVGSEEFQDKDRFKKVIQGIRERYDIRPTQDVVVMKADKVRGLHSPPATWTVNAEIFDVKTQTRKTIKAINARQEKLLSWNTWRSALKHHRVVYPVNAFYEWRDFGLEKNIPFEIRAKGQETFYLAGIGQPGKHPKTGEDVLETAIITQPGGRLLEWIHNHGGNRFRQPVFIDKDKIHAWLDPELSDAHEAESLLRQIEDGEYEARILKSIGNDETHTPQKPYDWAKFITKPDKSIEKHIMELFGSPAKKSKQNGKVTAAKKPTLTKAKVVAKPAKRNKPNPKKKVATTKKK